MYISCPVQNVIGYIWGRNLRPDLFLRDYNHPFDWCSAVEMFSCLFVVESNLHVIQSSVVRFGVSSNLDINFCL